MSLSQNDDSLASLRAPFDDEVTTKNVSPAPDKKDNFKGVVTAGWILAIVLPFLGIFLNVWLLKNADRYNYSKAKAGVALAISIALSAALLILLLTFVISFAVA